MMTFNFGNADGLFVPVTTDGDNYIAGNGNNDEVLAASSSIGNVITLGSGYGAVVIALQNSIGDVITLGNGNDDFVQIGDFHNPVAGNAQGDTITLGDGNGDAVLILNRGFQPQTGHNTITLGNGNNDVVGVGGFSTLPNVITVGDGDGDSVQGQIVLQGGTGDQITVGNGKNDTVFSGGGGTIRVGDGDGAVVWGAGDQITLGNGNNDTVISKYGGDTITVGNGNDTIHVATNDTVAVGKGQDVFAFDRFFESQPGGIGAVTITGFNPSKDVIVIQQALATSFTAHDDIHGNAVVTFPNDRPDQITLVGVHASDLHASDFQFNAVIS